MKLSATGRILFWRGGSLWIGLAGEPAGSRSPRSSDRAAIPWRARAISSSFRRWTSYTAALVTADQPHAFEARAQLVAQIFVEPESHEGRQLQRRYRKEGIVALPSVSLEPQAEGLATAYKKRASDTALIALARAAVAKLSGAIPGIIPLTLE